MRDREAGLTVFELLIALVLLAMIGVILGSSISTGARVWERSKDFPAADQTASLRQELRRWIEAMKPPQMPVGLRQEITATPDRFQFLTTAFFEAHPPETEGRVTITLMPKEDTTELKITLEALDLSGSPVQTESWAVGMIAGTARLQYYGQASNQDGGSWRETWTEPRALPDLVAIDLDDPTLDWPKFTVRPRL